MNRLIATSSASFVFGYIVGLKDRHYDNLLIRNDGTLFHIDFAYILGETIKGIDASKMAIIKDFYTFLNHKKWNEFIDISVKIYQILRINYKQLIQFGQIIFKPLYSSKNINEYLIKSLKINETDTNALQYFRQKLLNSPTNIKTNVKNKVHSFSMKRMSNKKGVFS